ncbi:MAG: hypothetical protein ACJA1R_001828, partial [Flavobacteriales bacterium]
SNGSVLTTLSFVLNRPEVARAGASLARRWLRCPQYLGGPSPTPDP